MKPTINCFLFGGDEVQNELTINSLKACEWIANIRTLPVASPSASSTIRQIAAQADTTYTLLYTKQTPLELGYLALQRMVQVMEMSRAGMVYADHHQMVNGVRTNAPVIDYQPGSLRDDFDFGSLLLFRTEAFVEAATRMRADYQFAGLYDLRLKLSQRESLVHINEYLYTEVESDTRKSGEKQFDYVDPKNREVQIEMEQACTEHLKEVCAYLPPVFREVDLNSERFPFEASVIIPVRNRIRTIEDAIRSALSQKTTFKYNIIVVDNHSTDGTTELIQQYAGNGETLIHLIPNRTDLGIGGCWNLGVNHPMCGKFTVQLDSDDVYKDEHTLQIMVDAFYKQHCAMVVGTYMMTDFDMNMIAPGIIDHREWTPHNGRNNALRINGLGAPRAFYTPLLRQIGVPNTSYGEDYALGLAFSRHYRIGRVYDVVYLCRRWEGNSDAALPREKVNAHNTYKDRLRSWELQSRQKRVRTMLAPARITSSAAQVDEQSIARRKCFLCRENRPPTQEWTPFKENYQVLVNPFPIFPKHLTIVDAMHTKQLIRGRMGDMLELAKELSDCVIFYNGPKCGASAPDHFHFQAGNKGFLPIEMGYGNIGKKEVARYGNSTVWQLDNAPITALSIETSSLKEALHLFETVYDALELKPGNEEPMMNIVSWFDADRWIICIFPREKHRPDCYFAEGEGNMLISPASVDLGGVLIIPLEKDFNRITETEVNGILSEVCLPEKKLDEIVQKVRKAL